MLTEVSFEGGIFFLINAGMHKNLSMHFLPANPAGGNLLIRNLVTFPFLTGT